MNRPKLKIYGERNTGTNYLSELIYLNLDVDLVPGTVPKFVQTIQESKFFPGNEFLRDTYFSMRFHKNLGWKHMLVKSPASLRRIRVCTDNLFFVTLSKNPYSWLLSLFKNPYHQNWAEKPDFEKFLTSPWRSVRREHGPHQFMNPVELWNQKNAAYIRLKAELPTVTLRYEDLLSDPEATVTKLAEEFSLRWRQSRFVNLLSSTKEGSKDFHFYRKYYLEEIWRKELVFRSIEIINDRLAVDVVRHFDYKLIC